MKNKEYTFHAGEAYHNFFKLKRRYKILKGSRASKKTTNTCFYLLQKILTNNYTNIVCIRNYSTTLKDSIFNELKRVALNYGLYDKFEWFLNPIKVRKKSTGQIILFRGLQDPDKLASIACPVGYFDTIWLEEAYELKHYEVWLKVEGTFRAVPDIEFIMTFNPWRKNWIYEVFFKDKLEDDLTELSEKGWQEYVDDTTLLLITNHRINEFLTDEDNYNYLKLKDKYPDMYNVASLGVWGSLSERVYDTYSVENEKKPEEIEKLHYEEFTIGIDFSLVNAKTAMTLLGLNLRGEIKVTVLEEFTYTNKNVPEHRKKTASDISDMLIDKMLFWIEKYSISRGGYFTVFVDYADLSFKETLEMRIRKHNANIWLTNCIKILIEKRISIIKYLMGENKFIISKNCPQTIGEFRGSCYDTYKYKLSDKLVREDENDDLINAVEYGLSNRMIDIVNWIHIKSKDYLK